MKRGDFKDHDFVLQLNSPCLGFPGRKEPVECEIAICMASGEFELEYVLDLVTGKEVEWEMLDADDRALIEKEGKYHVDIYCEELEEFYAKLDREEEKNLIYGIPKEQYKWPNEYTVKKG